MRSFILISVLCLQSVWGYGLPEQSGVGAFAYQDPAGNRYGGTYGLRDGQVVDTQGNFPPNFQFNTFQDLDNFFPDYFRNLGNLLQEAFDTNFESQKLAFDAARKAYDLTSNQAGYIPNFNYRFHDFSDFGGFPAEPVHFTGMPNFGDGFGAFAAARVGPGFNHQIAAINPPNPAMPNVDEINQNFDSRLPNDSNFVGVSTSSVSSSSNINGKTVNTQEAKTTINDNGKITTYKVRS